MFPPEDTIGVLTTPLVSSRPHWCPLDTNGFLRGRNGVGARRNGVLIEVFRGGPLLVAADASARPRAAGRCYRPRERAISISWTSLVPSPISKIFESR
jgi:hypothetical protein